MRRNRRPGAPNASDGTGSTTCTVHKRAQHHGAAWEGGADNTRWGWSFCADGKSRIHLEAMFICGRSSLSNNKRLVQMLGGFCGGRVGNPLGIDCMYLIK